MTTALWVARNEAMPLALRRAGMLAAAAGRTMRRFPWRYRVLRNSRPPSLSSDAPGALGPIWVFWAQGLDQSPLVVRKSIESISRFANGREVRILTADTYADYVTLPSVFVSKRAELGWAHFADVLRLALLVEHGGTWFDATILQVGPMPSATLSSDLVVPRQPKPDRIVSNWFIHARARHPLLIAWLDALTAYRELDVRTRPYMHMHYLMEGLVLFDARCEAILASATAPLDANPSLEIVRTAKVKGDATPWQQLTEKSWMHKLSYKAPAKEPIERWLSGKSAL